VDVVFPLLHGPYGEDGTVQGMLELADLPYVGSGVFGSAAAMDKGHMKRLFREAELPGVPWVLVKPLPWERDREAQLDAVVEELTFPMFVKPCNLGSSVGISRVTDRRELADAIDRARLYDRRVIVEEGVDAREIECSVLGNHEPLVSVPGEVVSHHEFYDYESKYTDGLADLIIPAPLTADQYHQVRELALRAFEAVDAAGLARVDFFLRRSDGDLLVNEINTMPGFTTTSMYPKLWEASGVSYSELIDRLIQLALERHRSRPAPQ
jgi:D-alanine-D-alanine ligase